MNVANEARDPAHVSYEAGRAALRDGHIDLAIRQFEISIAEYPHFKTLELLGEAWLTKGDPRRAIVPLAAATTLSRQVRAPALLAEAFLALGEAVEAHQVAHLAIERDPHNKKASRVLEATKALHTAECMR